MSFWCLYASYDVVWRNEVKWFSSNFCLKVGFSCLKTDLPSGMMTESETCLKIYKKRPRIENVQRL